MKNKIKVYSSCTYTRIGLEYAIRNANRLSGRAIPSHYPPPDFFSSAYSMNDIIILAMDKSIPDMFSLLDWIQITPLQQVGVVLILPKESPDWLRRFLRRKLLVLAELDRTISIEKFQLLLQDILNKPLTQISCDLATSPLTRREHEIIRRLLEGKNAMQISRALKLSCKTVSAHKRNALLKLGVHSLHALLGYRMLFPFADSKQPNAASLSAQRPLNLHTQHHGMISHFLAGQ